MYWYYPYPKQEELYANVQQEMTRQQPAPRNERRFSEDLLEKNIGAVITAYLTYENNARWNAKIITGTLRDVGRDYFLVRDAQTEKDHLLLNINLDYIVFEKPARLRQEQSV